MKTAIVTWISYTNFGTYLQAYALQQTLSKLGCESYIIDDSTIIQPFSLRRYLSRFKQILLVRTNPNATFFRRFRRNHLRIDTFRKAPTELNDRYNTFVCGSDQIWSPYLRFRPYYYLDFVADGKRRIAYAPSTGTGTCSGDYRRRVKPLIERFDALSVRESSGARMLSTFIDYPIEAVLDPTLLLTAADWQRLVHPVDEDGYILCYFLTPNEWYLRYARQYAERHHKRLLIFRTRPDYRHYGHRSLVAGPQEFVSYIYHADKIFTDSYHASIFSILFSKDFITFQRFVSNDPNNQNARIEDLFHTLGLTDFFIPEADLDRIETLPQPDHLATAGRLEAERQRSLRYLHQSLFP